MRPELKRKLYIAGCAAAGVVIVVLVLLILFGGSKASKYRRQYETAQDAFLKSDYTAAIRALDKAVDIQPTEEAYMLMAQSYEARGDREMAIQVLYLARTRVGGENINAYLSELKGEPDVLPLPTDTPTQTPSPGDGTVEIAGVRYDPASTTDLLLNAQGLRDSDIGSLGALTYLTNLSLADNGISDLTPMQGLTGLTFLDLSGNRVADLSALSRLTALKTLYLDGNPITDFGPLASLRSLRTLSIKAIDLTDRQLEALQEALPACSIFCDEPSTEIESVELGGRVFRADATELNLGGLGITDISELRRCSGLQKLDLRDNRIEDLSPLTELPELEWLCLWNNEISDLRPLMSLTKLRYLDLDGNRFTDISVLERLPDLEELWLNGNRLDSFKPLQKLTKLTRLGLKDTGLDDESLALLAGLVNLTELSIERNEGLGEEAFAALQEALPKCRISHSELVPAEPEETEPPVESEPPEETPEPVETPRPVETPKPTETTPPAAMWSTDPPAGITVSSDDNQRGRDAAISASRRWPWTISRSSCRSIPRRTDTK